MPHHTFQKQRNNLKIAHTLVYGDVLLGRILEGRDFRELKIWKGHQFLVSRSPKHTARNALRAWIASRKKRKMAYEIAFEF